MWSSVQNKGYTVVIVFTLLLGVFSHGKSSTSRVVDTTKTTQIQACMPGRACPEAAVRVTVKTLPGVLLASGGGLASGERSRSSSGR